MYFTDKFYSMSILAICVDSVVCLLYKKCHGKWEFYIITETQYTKM